MSGFLLRDNESVRPKVYEAILAIVQFGDLNQARIDELFSLF